MAGARPRDPHAVRARPHEAPPLRAHPGPGAGGAGPVSGFHAHRPGLPEAAAGRHELPPDALQAALQAEPGQQVGDNKEESWGGGEPMRPERGWGQGGAGRGLGWAGGSGRLKTNANKQFRLCGES